MHSRFWLFFSVGLYPCVFFALGPQAKHRIIEAFHIGVRTEQGWPV
jgi:hypothetical protein